MSLAEFEDKVDSRLDVIESEVGDLTDLLDMLVAGRRCHSRIDGKGGEVTGFLNGRLMVTFDDGVETRLQLHQVELL